VAIKHATQTLQCDAEHDTVISILSVHPFVCLPHSVIVLQWSNASLELSHHLLAHCSTFSKTIQHREIPTMQHPTYRWGKRS